jgi:WD40 repeat protein
MKPRLSHRKWILPALLLCLTPFAGAQTRPAPTGTDKAAGKTVPPAANKPVNPADKTAQPKPNSGAPPANNPAAPAKPQESTPAPFVKPNRTLGDITALTFSPDGKKLAVGTFGQVVVFDTAAWQQIGVFRQVEDGVRALAFNTDNQTLAIGSGLPGRTGQTTLWDIGGAQKPRSFPAQSDTVESVAFRKDGKGLLIGANDNKVRYVPDTGGKDSSLLDSHNGRVQAVAFSPKADSIFITGAMDKIVKVWDLKTVRNVINFDQSEAGITGLAFLSNGVQFVGSSLDGRLYWWGVNYDANKNTYNGYHFRTIGAHTGGVYALAASADEKRMVTGGADHAVCVWDINSGGQIRAFRDATTQPIYAVALSPDGKMAVGGGREGLIFVWDVEANKLLTTLVPPLLPASPASKPAAASSGTRKSGKRR